MQSSRNIPIAVLLVLSGLICQAPAGAQSTPPSGELFTAASGLSHSWINAILQDSLGFLWIGTHEGLNKYDGYSFQQFRYQPDTMSLSSNSIRCMAEGREGVLWIGTDFGLNKLDRFRGDLWNHYFPEPGDSVQRLNQMIHSLYVDTDGHVWMRTEKKLVVLDPLTGEMTRYNLYFDESNPFDPEETFAMQRDPSGYMWMGTKDGLQVLNPETGQLLVSGSSGDEGFPSGLVRTIYLDREGRIWCGTEGGLFLYQGEQFRDGGEILPELKDLDVRSITQNRKGELIIGTRESIVKVQPDLEKAEASQGFNRPSIYTRFSNINTLFVDGSEILWLGTSEGLVKIDQKPRKFHGITALNPNWTEVSSVPVTSIFQDPGGDLWIGTDGEGLKHLIPGSDRIVTYSSRSPLPSRRIPDDKIHAIHRDRFGSLWLGTGNGVSVMQPGMNRFYSFCSGRAKDLCSVFDKQHVYDILEDSRGLIWFAASNGIHMYNPTDRNILSIKRVHYGNEVLELRDVYCAAEDAEGRIWIGSSVGLIKHQPLQNTFEIFQAGLQNRNSNINSNTVFSLHTGSNGDLWVGTASGLNRYDPETNSFEFFRDPVELSELRIYGILEDSQGNLWMSSERGLVMYEPGLRPSSNTEPKTD